MQIFSKNEIIEIEDYELPYFNIMLTADVRENFTLLHENKIYKFRTVNMDLIIHNIDYVDIDIQIIHQKINKLCKTLQYY